MFEKKNLLIGGGILVGLYFLNPYTGSFRGEAETTEFSYQSSEVSIVNFVGKIIHTNSPDQQIHFITTHKNQAFTPRFDHIGGGLQISNFDKISSTSCNGFSWFWWGNSDDDAELKVGINNGSSHKFSDYPVVEIQTPDHIDLKITSSVISAKFGDLESLSIDMMGCGNASFGNITNDARINLSGSGDVEIASVGGSATTQLRGSGNVKINNVASDTTSNIRGSGDIEFGEIHGIHRMSIRGSGDIEVKKMVGDAELYVQGSGDIEIDDGDVNWFIAKVQGSGDIEYGGKLKHQKLNEQGSGEIKLN